MDRVRGAVAWLLGIVLLAPLGCVGASVPGGSSPSPAGASASPSAPGPWPSSGASDDGLAVACSLVRAADGFDPAIGTVLAAFDAGDVERFGRGTAEVATAVDAFVAQTEARRAELPPALNERFAAAAAAAASDADMIERVSDGRFSDAELDAFMTAMRDLYQWPAALREDTEKSFPGSAGCGPSPRSTAPPDISGSVTMTIEEPVTRTWTGPARCLDASGDGTIDDVLATFEEDGHELEFVLVLAWAPPVLELNRAGTRVGYIATTQDHSLRVERTSPDLMSGRLTFAQLPADSGGGFLQPAERPLDGAVEWTCTR